MLEFIIGRAGSGKTRYCLDAMRQEMTASPMGKALFLIVPEHMTFKIERELAGSPELDGFTRSYVFGFRRLARQVLLETGGAAWPRITEVGKRLLLSKVMVRHLKELQVFGKAARQRNFGDSLSVMIEEFKSYGIKPQGLIKAAASMENGPLKGKLQDLSVIYLGFADGMRGRYNDAEDMLETLAEKIPEARLMQQAEVWVDGFVFFNPQEMKILRSLFLTAKNVHITLCGEELEGQKHVAETSIFHRQWKTLYQVGAAARELGLDYCVHELTDQLRFQASALYHIEKNMFQFPFRVSTEQAGVQLVEAANRRLEAEAVAVDILRLCREENVQWKEIGVLVRDSSSYENLLQVVFQDYKIPFFSDNKKKSVHHPLAELLRSSLESLHGWRYEALFRCFKTDFFPVTRQQVDALENYVLAFGIRGNRWTMAEDWTYHKRLSLEEDTLDDEVQQKLDEINHIRRLVAAPMQVFAEQIEAAKNVRQMTKAVYDLFIALDIPGTLEKWAGRAENEGSLIEAREHQQIWNDIVELMDQLVETSGEDEMSLKQYEEVIGDGLDGLQISLIPPGLDYVTIASFDQNSLDNCRALYIVGANEGIMPRRVKTEGLLTDADRMQLAAIGLELANGVSGDNFAENYLLYKAFSLSREYLWLSYPLADNEGKGLNPSPLVQRLREIVPKAVFTSIPLEILPGDEKWLVAEGRQSVSKLAAALRTYRERQQLSPVWQDVYNWALDDAAMRPVLRKAVRGLFATARQEALPPELAQKLYIKNHRLRGSVTRFERFRSCPFQHFAQYGLSLKERSEFRFAAPDFGILMHASLKAFGEKMQQQKRRWSDVDEKECHRVCGEIVGELAPKLQNEILLSSAQYQHLLGRIRHTVERAVKRLIAFDASSSFRPVQLEKSFGMGLEGFPPLTYKLENGCEIEVIGQIDRIDTDESGKYFLIIDYKSGNAYLNLIDVYYGLRLQLLTYLLVVRNAAAQAVGEAAIPAGVLYYFLKNPILNEKRRLTEKEAEDKLSKLLRMPGWVLADSDVIRKIDDSLKFIKVALKTNGEIYQTSRSQVKTEEEFMAILGYVDGMLADTGRQILEGDVAARPYAFEKKQACDYCAYRSVCQFDTMVSGYEYRQLSKIDDSKVLDTMKEAEECPGPKHN